MEQRTCTIEGCTNTPRDQWAEWCPKHYHRWYRHGDPLARIVDDGFTISHGRKYVRRSAPTHPMAMKNGYVYVHRAVLFDTIGYGPHLCHWCGSLLTWRVNLHVDHLDGHGDNNDPANLVASCPDCNTGRANRAKALARRGRGAWSGVGAQRGTTGRLPVKA